MTKTATKTKKKNLSIAMVTIAVPSFPPVKKGRVAKRGGRKYELAGDDFSENDSLDASELLNILIEIKNGNFDVKMPVNKTGLSGKIADTLNDIIYNNKKLIEEFTKARINIGKEGKINQHIVVTEARGEWRTGVESLNLLISDLVYPVKEIDRILSAVAKGNLSNHIPLEAGDRLLQGEFARIAKEVNGMVKRLNLFAMEVTRVAREVGSEGKLGSQAAVEGVEGIWKDVTESVNQMIINLHETTLLNQEQDWLKSNLAKFAQMLQGQKNLQTVAKRILSELAQVITAHYGAFYIVKTTEEVFPKLKLFASYAYKSEKHIPKEFLVGEGLVGQCAQEKERIILTNVPDGYVKITSGLGQAKPANLVILPVLFENNVKAVIELGSLDTFSQIHIDFLSQLTESIGIVLNTIETNTRTEELLAQSQSLASELKIQQEELRRTNDELQDKALLLVKQKDEVETKNKEVEEARRSLEEKAEQLTLSSKYKSEFLANMSHELRTPLNSLLILAQQLYENPEGNLNEKQTRYAKTIYSCGDDLLQLINDILDLSKIESGFITANISNVHFSEMAAFIETTFKPLSETKKLRFKIEIDSALPESMDTDFQRLNQILKNLLSNAFKFTEKGEVKLKIYNASRTWKLFNQSLNNANQVVAFSIIDSGIGIPLNKQSIIFEAFQQAEGSTSRKYGGTGLGLSICRGLAELLGGTIELESEAGIGSKFTLYLPMDKTGTIESYESVTDYTISTDTAEKLSNIFDTLSATESGIQIKNQESISDILNEIEDDRDNIVPHDKVILVVEDDALFGKILIDRAHTDGLKVVIAVNYADIFDFVSRYTPIAITLDVNLPAANGWKVLDLLKNDLNYRHIPIHLISGEDNKMLALKRGARSFLLKPLNNDLLNELFADIIYFNNKDVKQLLVIEDNGLESLQLVKLFEGGAIQITSADTIKKALELLKEKDFDTIIMDYALQDFLIGLELIKKNRNNKTATLPIVIYSDKDFTKQELSQFGKISNGIIVEGVNSIDHLLEETFQFLHVNYTKIPIAKRRIIENHHSKIDILTGKKILVVDDDVRNLFAITTVFERYNINVLTAESGTEAIDLMNELNDIEMVLMDIMMPEMDGYETIRRIRRELKNNSLPIIAVTAKAMIGDRQKCIEAGASDYVTKPLKIDQLLSMMRMWFYK